MIILAHVSRRRGAHFIFLDLKPHAKFQNPRITTSGSKESEGESLDNKNLGQHRNTHFIHKLYLPLCRVPFHLKGKLVKNYNQLQ